MKSLEEANLKTLKIGYWRKAQRKRKQIKFPKVLQGMTKIEINMETMLSKGRMQWKRRILMSKRGRKRTMNKSSLKERIYLLL